jgi:hypothetical protein
MNTLIATSSPHFLELTNAPASAHLLAHHPAYAIAPSSLQDANSCVQAWTLRTWFPVAVRSLFGYHYMRTSPHTLVSRSSLLFYICYLSCSRPSSLLPFGSLHASHNMMQLRCLFGLLYPFLLTSDSFASPHRTYCPLPPLSQLRALSRSS